MEKENSSVGLFSSFTNQRLDLLGQDKAEGKKKSSQSRPAQKKSKNKNVVVAAAANNDVVIPGIGIKISDRLFSETTLNYVASGLADISLNDSDNAVFASPNPAAVDTVGRQEAAEVEDKTEEKFSPAIGQAQATSTPNLVKVRLSAAQSLQSP